MSKEQQKQSRVYLVEPFILTENVKIKTYYLVGNRIEKSQDVETKAKKIQTKKKTAWNQ